MNADRLLAHYEKISDAPDAIPRLRRFILNLAVRGKLVRQNPNDEPASELLKRIAAEKARLVKAGKIRKESVLPLVATYEALFSVPNVWEWTRVGSTAYVEMGQSPPSEHYNRTGHGIPFSQGKADFGKRYPTARYWCTQPKKYAGPGDIMISVRAPVGPTNVASEPCCIGRGLAALRPHNGIDRNYLLRCLEAFEHVLAALGFGTTFVAPELCTDSLCECGCVRSGLTTVVRWELGNWSFGFSVPGFPSRPESASAKPRSEVACFQYVAASA